MVEFGGWDMPVQYTGIIEEHQATRTRAGLFDICHMGEIIVQGEEAERFLQHMTVNDVAQLAIGQCHYTLLCNASGGILDDLIIYRIDRTKYMLVVNAGTKDGDFQWLEEHNTYGVELQDVSAKTCKLDLQGPAARALVQHLVPDHDFSKLKYFHFIECRIHGMEAIISRTGYTGELGYELYVTAHEAEKLWDLLMTEGARHGIKPVGLGARDTLRLEMGYSLYGHELLTDITPLEAGLGWVVKLNKADFIGKDALLSQKADTSAPLSASGKKKKLVAFEMMDKAVPRNGCKIVADSTECGLVTSGSFGPSVEKFIGLGYVDAKVNAEAIGIKVRDKVYKANVVKTPFYKQGTVKG
jgi:aminomethyltransferase